MLPRDHPYRIINTKPTKLSEYVAIISEERSENSQDLMLFRGHRVAGWKLLPKIGRPETRLKAKLNTPLKTVELEMFKSFKRLSLPFLTKIPDTTLENLAVAQHHGLPTRLLDWTSNALAALWFAVRNPSKEENTDAAVWILHPFDVEFLDDGPSFDPFGVDEVLVYRPRHLTTRIIAQSGCFTVHPLIPPHMPQQGYAAIEDDSPLVPRLKKIEIPQASFSDLRDDLERHGVSDLTMFPDLEGVARFIEWCSAANCGVSVDPERW
jgi:hypothetical protein